MFEFNPKSENDPRAVFANQVCQLLLYKHKGNVYNAIIDIPDIRESFGENVRNIYELVDSEIPLFALYDLERHDKDNYGFNDAEYAAAKERALRACVEYYTQKQ